MPTTPRRARCPRCERPQSTCLCGWVTPVANQAQVLVLQHPGEVRQAKGSAKLLQMSLARCAVQVGETFDQAVLHGWLHEPPAATLLLYPGNSDLPQPALAPSVNGLSNASRTRLVILDGTWRKSLKMLHLNPGLQALPRLALHTAAASRYLVRKAPRPGQLSTLEACCQALAQLEQAPERYAPLLDAFDRFVAAQALRMPSSTPGACP